MPNNNLPKAGEAGILEDQELSNKDGEDETVIQYKKFLLKTRVYALLA